MQIKAYTYLNNSIMLHTLPGNFKYSKYLSFMALIEVFNLASTLSNGYASQETLITIKIITLRV